MKNEKIKIPLTDARHPYRQVAIAILEHIDEHVDISGKLWYELEDAIVDIIKKRLTKGRIDNDKRDNLTKQGTSGIDS